MVRIVVLSERGGIKENVGFECLYKIKAGWRTAGINGSFSTFDLKVDLWSVFSEGMNQWISCLLRALRRKGEQGCTRK